MHFWVLLCLVSGDVLPDKLAPLFKLLMSEHSVASWNISGQESGNVEVNVTLSPQKTQASYTIRCDESIAIDINRLSVSYCSLMIAA